MNFVGTFTVIEKAFSRSIVPIDNEKHFDLRISCLETFFQQFRISRRLQDRKRVGGVKTNDLHFATVKGSLTLIIAKS